MDVSFLIPARNEMFLAQTVGDILAHIEADSEIIIVCDGAWATPPIADHERVHIIYHPESVGQRAATNEAARVARGKYVCKIDAHCSIDQGFDRKLVEAGDKLGRDVTQIPAMYNLHAFDWMCKKCGHRTYQGPTPQRCEQCGSNTNFERVLVWKKRAHKLTEFWRFDHDLHFQYWGDYKNRPEAKGQIVDVMSAIGACFFMRKDRFFELGGLDETHGSWGQFGAEIACKSWLSGGRHVVNRDTYFVHMFRTQGADFSFPYPLSGRDVDKARAYSKALWMENKWPGQVRPLSWLIDKFAPLPGWHEPVGADALRRVQEAGRRFKPSRGGPVLPKEIASVLAGEAVPAAASQIDDVVHPVPAPRATGVTKGFAYYSDCRGDQIVLSAVRKQLKFCAEQVGAKIVSVTLDPVDFGFNRVLPLERGYLTMFKQILRALEELDTDVVYLTEHDVLYHVLHFEFEPSRRDAYFYNQNVWKVDSVTGHALHYLCSQTSGCCADRALLVEHYRKRVAAVERDGFSRRNGFEPGTRKLRHGGFDDVDAITWLSRVPNVDIRHGQNLTPSRWRKEEFRNQKYCQGWTESDSVPGWGRTKGRFAEFIEAIPR